MIYAVIVYYNKDKTDFSIYGPCRSYEEGMKLRDLVKRTRKAAIGAEVQVLHDPRIVSSAAERLGMLPREVSTPDGARKGPVSKQRQP